jgi:hypothetical protein
MNENKHPYSPGHRGMKRNHKDEKGCHAIQDSVEGRNLGKEDGGDEEWRMWKLQGFNWSLTRYVRKFKYLKG